MLRVGAYLTAAQINDDPGLLERLRNQIGLSWVIVNFSGVMPDYVLQKSPLYSRSDKVGAIRRNLARDIYGRTSTADLA